MPERFQPIPATHLLHEARCAKQQQEREQQDEELIKTERRRNVPVQQVMRRSQPATTGTLQARQRVEEALWVERIPVRSKVKEQN